MVLVQRKIRSTIDRNTSLIYLVDVYWPLLRLSLQQRPWVSIDDTAVAGAGVGCVTPSEFGSTPSDYITASKASSDCGKLGADAGFGRNERSTVEGCDELDVFNSSRTWLARTTSLLSLSWEVLLSSASHSGESGASVSIGISSVYSRHRSFQWDGSSSSLWIKDAVVNRSSNTTWNCVVVLPVVKFNTWCTSDEWIVLSPQNTPQRDRDSHREILLPDWSVGLSTYTGHPHTCIFCNLCRGRVDPKKRSLGEILLLRGNVLYM